MNARAPRKKPAEKEAGPPRIKPVTLKDVAEAAGVSVATVSLVVNEKKNARIGEAARARVLRALEELDYRPNALAKHLVQGDSKFIGLVADEIASTPFAGQIVHGAQDEAWKHGYVLLITNTEGNEHVQERAIAMMLEHKVRGILYSTWYHHGVQVPAALQGTPTVLVNCFDPLAQLPAVVPDEVQGGYTATQLLLERDHRKIAFINTLSDSPAREGRRSGYLQALREAGIGADPALIFDAAPNQSGGYALTEAIVNSGASAVFCYNDRVAMGLYDGVRERGLRVPEDLSVVGFDNQTIIAANVRPPLTTVGLPHYELGVHGIRRLLGLEPEDPALLTVPCPPVLRESVSTF